MKRLFTLFIFLISIFAFSQEFKFEEVVQVEDSSNKDELFNRARSWIGKTFKDEKYVIATEDRATGEISGNGIVKYRTSKIYFGVACVEGYVSFKLNIFVKDGRYKYIFDTFRHSGTAGLGSREIDYGLLTMNTEPPQPSRGNANKKAWNDIKDKTTIEANELIESLKKAMNQKSENSKDW